MITYRQDDWAASPSHPSTVTGPYLMGTGVVTGEDTGTRPLSPPHSHADAMLAWCYRGTVWVHLQDAMWRLAPGQGVWIPAHTPHTAHHESDSTGCYTYIPDSSLIAPIDDVTRVLVPRAVQEMLLHLGINDMPTDLRVRIQSVLIEMLQQPLPEAATEWGEVPMPADERVAPLVQAVLADPGDPLSTQDLFLAHGLHERTVLRIFQNDVGMSFGRWRTAAATRRRAPSPRHSSNGSVSRRGSTSRVCRPMPLTRRTGGDVEPVRFTTVVGSSTQVVDPSTLSTASAFYHRIVRTCLPNFSLR